MAEEKRSVGRPPKNAPKPAQNYDWLKTRSERERSRIVNWCREKGVPIPAGPHLDPSGNSMIDENGIRMVPMEKDFEKPHEDIKRIRDAKRRGYEITDTEYEIELRIPQKDYEKQIKGYEEKHLERTRAINVIDGPKKAGTSNLTTEEFEDAGIIDPQDILMSRDEQERFDKEVDQFKEDRAS